MTYQELLKTGQNGVYRADLNEFFIEGQEPPLPQKIAAAPLAPKEPVIVAAKLATAKGDKENG